MCLLKVVLGHVDAARQLGAYILDVEEDLQLVRGGDLSCSSACPCRTRENLLESLVRVDQEQADATNERAQ